MSGLHCGCEKKIPFDSVQSPTGWWRHMWFCIILVEQYLLAQELSLTFCLDGSVKTDCHRDVHLTVGDFTFSHILFMDNAMAIPPDTKHGLFDSYISTVGLTCRRPTPFSAALIFEQISAVLNTSSLICLSQLMRSPAIERVRQVYAMHRVTNGHGSNV